MSIFEGTIFIFRFFSFIFQFLFSSFLNMNIKYVEIFQVFGNIFSVYKKVKTSKFCWFCIQCSVFPKKERLARRARLFWRAWHRDERAWQEPGLGAWKWTIFELDSTAELKMMLFRLNECKSIVFVMNLCVHEWLYQPVTITIVILNRAHQTRFERMVCQAL